MNIIDLIQLRLKVYVINMDDNHKNSEELKGETRGMIIHYISSLIHLTCSN